MNYDQYQFIKADGFDDAIVAIDCKNSRFIYSTEKALKILEKQVDRKEAIEFLEKEIKEAYFGKSTPVWI